VPVVAGAGVAGSGNVTPHASSIEPPVLGNPRLTFAVQGGLGGAAAVLVVDTKVPPTNRIPAAGEVAGHCSGRYRPNRRSPARATLRDGM